MRKLLLTLSIPLFSIALLFGQEITHQDIEPYVKRFQLSAEDGVIIDLRKAFKDAQFVVLGETHYSRNISKFTKFMLPLLAETGYGNFAVEVGPFSATILDRLAKNPNTTIEGLRAFNKQYYYEEDEAFPIPFFEGVEDAEFLKAAGENNFRIFGIDQEFFNAPPHLFDQIYESTSRQGKIEGLKKLTDQVSTDYFLRDLEEDRFNIYQAFLSNDTINQFFEVAEAENGSVAPIVDAMKESWEIYNWSRTRRYSHQKRVSYIRELFKEEYNRNPDDKYLIKIGRLHAGRRRQLGAYDVGHLAATLAKKRGTKSLHIGFLRGYYGEDETSVGNTWESQKGYMSFSFNSCAHPDQWTIISLHELADRLEKGEIEYPSDLSFHILLSFLENFDYLIIPPSDQPQMNLIGE